MAATRLWRFVTFTLALGWPVALPQPTYGGDRLDQEIAALAERQPTPELQQAVEDHGRSLRERKTPEAQGAIDFFYRLRAKKVLLAFLHCKNPYDLLGPNQHYFFEHCTDLFEVEDIPQLFEAACTGTFERHHPDFGDLHAAQWTLLNRLARTTSGILGIEYAQAFPITRPLPSRTDLRLWWLAACKRAKATGKHGPELDRVIDYFELIDAVAAKPTTEPAVTVAATPPPAPAPRSNKTHNYALLALVLFALAVPTLGFFISRWREKAKANGEAKS